LIARSTPTIENANLVWEDDFNFAAAALDDLGRDRIVAYVEEVDRHMPAALPQGVGSA